MGKSYHYFDLIFNEDDTNDWINRNLDLDNRQPPVNEEIYIPQHPGGRPKELGIFDSNYSGANCRVLSYGSGCSPTDMKYTCDTEGGSSGSPVLSRSTHKVVALHHCGGACNGNLGAPIYMFYSEIEQFLTPCVTNADCDDNDACTTDTCSAGTCINAYTCPTPAPTPPPTPSPTPPPTACTLLQNPSAIRAQPPHRQLWC